jgi:hypothetical protein
MTDGVIYRRKNLSAWNEERRGEIELDAFARGYLGNAEITDRDRIALPCGSFGNARTTWRRATGRRR